MYFIPSNQRFVTLFIKTFPLCSVNGLNPRVTLKCVVNGSLWHGKRFKSAGGFAQCESTSHSMTSFIKFVYFLLIVYNFCHLKMTPLWPRTKFFVNFVINFISFLFTSANYFYFCFWAFTFFKQKKKYFNLSYKTFSWHWQYHSEDRSIHTPLHIDTFYLHCIYLVKLSSM